MAAQRILLVEDDQHNRRLLSDILLREGYRVDATADTDGARGLLDRHEYALVIADGQMPASLVVDAAVRLGAKTAVMSAYRFRMRRAQSEGHDTMIRPIRPSELLAAVERHIGRPAEPSYDSCAQPATGAEARQEPACASG
jgi:DNA-binding response OmpR family regulator